MKGFILLVLGIGVLHTTSAVTHSLKYFYTASSEVPNIPEFVVVGMVDGVQIVYYDSISQRVVSKQDWMNKRTDTQYWERETRNFLAAQKSLKDDIDTLKQRFNQSRGRHTWMIKYGCQWDDETGKTDGFDQRGYDGEDFLTYNMKTFTWIATKRQAVITQEKLNKDFQGLSKRKIYLTQTCIDWLKNYVNYGKSILMRTVPPSVSLLQETPSFTVTCQATGFYPSGVEVFWQKDGQEQHENVKNGETLPNDDGTFQKRSHLTVKPEEWKNNKYQCVVQVTGIKEDFIKVLTESEIQTNRDEPPPIIRDDPAPIIRDDPAPNIVLIIGVLVALFLVINVVGFVIWKKKKSKKDFVPASGSGTHLMNEYDDLDYQKT